MQIEHFFLLLLLTSIIFSFISVCVYSTTRALAFSCVHIYQCNSS